VILTLTLNFDKPFPTYLFEPRNQLLEISPRITALRLFAGLIRLDSHCSSFVFVNSSLNWATAESKVLNNCFQMTFRNYTMLVIIPISIEYYKVLNKEINILR